MASRSLASRPHDRTFFTFMGAAVAVLVFAGFARTYYLSEWVSQPERAPQMTALLHVHALAFSLWIMLQAIQPALVAGGRVSLHRRLGYGGAGLALLVWLLGNWVSARAMNVGYKGVGDPFAFYAVTFFSMQAFAIIVALGIRRRRDADAHKRLMLLSSASILEAAVGRIPLQTIASTAPLSFYLGADLVIFAGVAYDLVTRGRVHPVWTWGGGLLIASQVFRIAIMHSAPWLEFAHRVAAIV